MKERTKIAAGTGSAVGLSAIASVIGLCCIGPWSVAVLGVPGAVAMARFAFLKPYALGMAGVLLAWAFWRVYFRARTCADIPCAPASSLALRIALWLALVVLVLALFAEPLQWILVDPTPEALRHE